MVGKLNEKSTTLISSIANERDRNEHNSLCKNDRHYICRINFQRDILTSTTILFTTNNLLCILYRHFTCSLYKQNRSGNNQQQNNHFEKEHYKSTCFISHTRNKFLE